MAIDFDTMIETARAEGKSYEDIAKEFADRLNRMEDRETKVGPKTEFFHNLEDEFWNSADKGRFDYRDVVRLYMLVGATEPKSKVSKMNEDEMKEFCDYVEDAIDNIEEIYFVTKETKEKLEKLTDNDDAVKGFLSLLGL